MKKAPRPVTLTFAKPGAKIEDSSDDTDTLSSSDGNSSDEPKPMPKLAPKAVPTLRRSTGHWGSPVAPEETETAEKSDPPKETAEKSDLYDVSFMETSIGLTFKTTHRLECPMVKSTKYHEGEIGIGDTVVALNGISIDTHEDPFQAFQDIYGRSPNRPLVLTFRRKEAAKSDSDPAAAVFRSGIELRARPDQASACVLVCAC